MIFMLSIGFFAFVVQLVQWCVHARVASHHSHTRRPNSRRRRPAPGRALNARTTALTQWLRSGLACIYILGLCCNTLPLCCFFAHDCCFMNERRAATGKREFFSSLLAFPSFRPTRRARRRRPSFGILYSLQCVSNLCTALFTVILSGSMYCFPFAACLLCQSVCTLRTTARICETEVRSAALRDAIVALPPYHAPLVAPSQCFTLEPPGPRRYPHAHRDGVIELATLDAAAGHPHSRLIAGDAHASCSADHEHVAALTPAAHAAQTDAAHAPPHASDRGHES